MFAKCVASKHLWRSKAAKHGTRRRYNEGCRCEDCTADNTACHQEYRQRLIGAEPANPSSVVTVSSPVTPGPVEAGVEAEIAELADARPGLAAAALALARILDNPRAVSKPAGRRQGAGGVAGQATFGVRAWSSRPARAGADDVRPGRRLTACGQSRPSISGRSVRGRALLGYKRRYRLLIKAPTHVGLRRPSYRPNTRTPWRTRFF